MYKIVIVVLILIVVGMLYASSAASVPKTQGDVKKAEENVRELYNVITGADAEIIRTTEQNGLHKILVRFKDAAGRDTLQDVFVTIDGMFLTDRLINLEVQKSILRNQSAFAQCLFDKQVRILGLNNDPATQAQLQLIGAFSSRIYADCGGTNLALCQQLNITQVPVIFNNGALVQGPLALNWFEQNTGCYMTADAKIPV